MLMQMPESRPLPAEIWVPAKEAERLLSVSWRGVRRLVESGHIRSRQIPGTKPRYALSDVLKMLRKYQ